MAKQSKQNPQDHISSHFPPPPLVSAPIQNRPQIDPPASIPPPSPGASRYCLCKGPQQPAHGLAASPLMHCIASHFRHASCGILSCSAAQANASVPQQHPPMPCQAHCPQPELQLCWPIVTSCPFSWAILSLGIPHHSCLWLEDACSVGLPCVSSWEISLLVVTVPLSFPLQLLLL